MMNKEASNKWSMNAKRWINNNHKGWSPLCMGSSSRWFWLLATSPTLLLGQVQRQRQRQRLLLLATSPTLLLGQVQSNLYHRLCHLYHIRICKLILKTCFTRINITCIVYTNQNYLPCYKIVNFQCGISCSFNVHQLWKVIKAHDKNSLNESQFQYQVYLEDYQQ